MVTGAGIGRFATRRLMVKEVSQPDGLAVLVEINDDVAGDHCAGNVPLCRRQEDDMAIGEHRRGGRRSL